MGNTFTTYPVDDKKWNISIDIQDGSDCNINYVLKSSESTVQKTIVGNSGVPITFSTNLLSGRMCQDTLRCGFDGDLEKLRAHTTEMILELELLLDGDIHDKPSVSLSESYLEDSEQADD